MKTIATIACAVLFGLHVFQAEACDCKYKTQLDARDWNHAALIFQAKILEVESDESAVHFTFEIEEVFKGEDPGELRSISYSLDGDHALIHQMDKISKGQHWVLFADVESGRVTLMDTKRDGFCALSRNVVMPKRDASVVFLAEMKVSASGPKQLFFPDGTLMAEGQFLKGMATGDWVYYDHSGKIVETGEYVDGKRSGAWYRYTMNPATGRKFVYAKDQYEVGRMAEYEEYDDKGKTKSRHEFGEEGEYSATFFNDKGIVYNTIVTDPATTYAVYTDYHPSGNIKQVRYVEDGRLIRRIEYKESYYDAENQNPTVIAEEPEEVNLDIDLPSTGP